MWLWEVELRELGFRQKSARYWLCERRHGLWEGEHLSVYADARTDGERRLFEVHAFHVTFGIGIENVHFYYHESADNEWAPGGHTSRAEVERLGASLAALRARADAVAASLAAALAPLVVSRS